MKISETVAIVTGGASGLGEATVRNFAAGGAKVAIFDMNEARGAQVAAELGDNVIFSKVDVTSEDAVKEGIASAMGAFGRIDACVNCAGIGIAMKTMGKEGPHDYQTFRKVLEINLFGTFNVLRLAVEQMVENEPNADGERGVIVNTASVAAFDGQKGQVAYSASKGAIVGMTLPIARDLAFYGIRICTIAPGLFLTPLFEGLGEKVVESLSAQVTFPKRLGKPSEYGELARNIVESPYLNGETIRLDGAIRLP
ncbi:MAG: 3-hydroxyacyl-CoA dehydrogenase [Salaquimonas sp.]|jgi:NAD(P)-dependent dehydrogenase (short-subunit alcohol dehydrogenase family)|nr:3-hydroxyacyl-CoA dehydrogenase [Salaquimonas sp.]